MSSSSDGKAAVCFWFSVLVSIGLGSEFGFGVGLAAWPISFAWFMTLPDK